jgi:hypothetical protein
VGLRADAIDGDAGGDPGFDLGGEAGGFCVGRGVEVEVVDVFGIELAKEQTKNGICVKS